MTLKFCLGNGQALLETMYVGDIFKHLMFEQCCCETSSVVLMCGLFKEHLVLGESVDSSYVTAESNVVLYSSYITP